jgi:NADPH2:quinone reductase
MKAMVIREFGPPEVMRLEDVSTPEPGADEVLIRVHAVSVNRTLDLAVRAGTYAVAAALPHILGVDPSGVVAAVGPGVTSCKVGDRVVTRQILRPATATAGPSILGVHAWGGYAEYVKVPVTATHPIPEGLDFVVATVVARHAPTALSMLRDVAKVAPDEWVLVMGASGGLGIAGIQVATSLGARVIAAAGADDRVRAAVGSARTPASIIGPRT